MSSTTILPVSDIHLEFEAWFIPPMENEKDIIVVLAGDIGIGKKPITYMDFITNTCDRFKNVIWIAGNHEHYNCNMGTTLAKIWNATLEFENLYVVEKETVLIDDIAFVCATLWTDFDNNNPITMYDAELMMTDYRVIRIGPDSEPWKYHLKPLHTLADHKRAVEFIFPEIEKQKKAGKKVVVVTHHLPSFLSISDEFKGDSLNGAYATELFDEVAYSGADIWIHGHSHRSNDYFIGKTRIINNPRGYAPNDINPDFNETLTIEI